MESGLPKLAWVAAPLLAALLVLAWQALRGRPPTRLALNVWASLLLLVYLLTTAGLGVFWVAQQQLPVFDWHYLFGYGTLLLLVLHLWLNSGVVWRHLTRRVRPPAAQAPAFGVSRGPTRRAVTVVGAAGAAAGVAGWLGWRQGHEAGRLAVLQELGAGSTALAPGGFARGGPDLAALALVERFHALSSSVRRGGVPGAPPVSWGNPPPPFKRISGDGALPLPAPLRAADDTASPLTALATALWHTSAVTLARGSLALRASPSSGALFATELYLITRDLPGLPVGAWHYDVPAHALVPLRTVGIPALVGVTGAAVGDAAAAVVATGIFRRTGYKYRDRAYRYMLADLGHALENLRLAAGAARLPLRFLHGFDEGGLAAALGLGACGVGAFFDDEAAAPVGVDPVQDWVVHFAAVGVPAA